MLLEPTEPREPIELPEVGVLGTVSGVGYRPLIGGLAGGGWPGNGLEVGLGDRGGGSILLGIGGDRIGGAVGG